MRSFLNGSKKFLGIFRGLCLLCCRTKHTESLTAKNQQCLWNADLHSESVHPKTHLGICHCKGQRRPVCERKEKTPDGGIARFLAMSLTSVSHQRLLSPFSDSCSLLDSVLLESSNRHHSQELAKQCWTCIGCFATSIMLSVLTNICTVRLHLLVFFHWESVCDKFH